MESLQPIFCQHEELLEKIQLIQETERRRDDFENEGGSAFRGPKQLQEPLQ
jgi:hypothetical protein